MPSTNLFSPEVKATDPRAKCRCEIALGPVRTLVVIVDNVDRALHKAIWDRVDSCIPANRDIVWENLSDAIARLGES